MTIKRILVVLIVGIFVFSFQACKEKSPMEKAGEEVEKAGEAMKEAGEEAGEMMKEAGEAMKEAGEPEKESGGYGEAAK